MATPLRKVDDREKKRKTRKEKVKIAVH